MLKRLPGPTIFAHRGASAYAPENTLAAFDLAVRQGADALEMDLKLSADGEVVVIHDQSLDRTTTGRGRVSALPLADLRALDAGSSFDVAFQGEPIPTLEQVLVQFGRRVLLNLELTNYLAPADRLPEQTAALVKRHHLEENILFSSFNPLALGRIRRLLPGSATALLSLGGLAGGWERSWLWRALGCQALHVEVRDATARLAQRVHRLGARLNVYTVNRAEEALALVRMGVDGLFTNDPPLIRRALHELGVSGPPPESLQR